MSCVGRLLLKTTTVPWRKHRALKLVRNVDLENEEVPDSPDPQVTDLPGITRCLTEHVRPMGLINVNNNHANAVPS